MEHVILEINGTDVLVMLVVIYFFIGMIITSFSYGLSGDNPNPLTYFREVAFWPYYGMYLLGFTLATNFGKR